MEIEETSLWREVERVVSSGGKPVHFEWTAEIRANDETIDVLKVLSVDIVQDYERKFGDEILAVFVIPAGTYTKRVYPYKDHLEVTLYKTPLKETQDTEDTEEEVQTEIYTATLIDSGTPVLHGDQINNIDEESMNLTGLFDIHFQLVNKALEQLRMITIGGVYRNCTVSDVIKGVLTHESRKVDVEDARMPQGVDMVEADNQKKREHIVIPQGTKLVDLPEYIHRKCGGVYSTGLGYYMREDWWYVYPCYDTSRFNDATQTLTIINVPRNKLVEIERTYRKDGDNLLVLATGDIRFRDDSQLQQLNAGNGVRFADADKMMGGFAKVKDNKVAASRGANVTEVKAFDRPNGNNQVRLSPRQITANPYQEYSDLARRQGGVIGLEWQHSEPAQIFPGMMVKLLYLEGDDIMEAFGVLLKTHHFVQKRGPGLVQGRYVSHTVLSVFVKPLEIAPQDDEGESPS